MRGARSASSPPRATAITPGRAIDRERQLVAVDGKFLEYEVLILATGSAARIPPVLAPFRPQFLTLNSLDDLLTLRRRRQKALERKGKPRWAIIGACSSCNWMSRSPMRCTAISRPAASRCITTRTSARSFRERSSTA
jgi:hypothetical protein